jgi:hypothetical protein
MFSRYGSRDGDDKALNSGHHMDPRLFQRPKLDRRCPQRVSPDRQSRHGHILHACRPLCFDTHDPILEHEHINIFLLGDGNSSSDRRLFTMRSSGAYFFLDKVAIRLRGTCFTYQKDKMSPSSMTFKEQRSECRGAWGKKANEGGDER